MKMYSITAFNPRALKIFVVYQISGYYRTTGLEINKTNLFIERFSHFVFLYLKDNQKAVALHPPPPHCLPP